MDGAILLHDKVGEKTSSGFAGLVKRSTTVNVLRGELLVPVPGDEIVTRNDGEKPHNYRVKKKEAITMYCDPVNDVAPLGNYEFLLLEGIQSRDARYEVFLSGDKIDWGQTLKSGSDVYVIVPGTTFSSAAVPTQGAPRAAAKVRYVGGSGTEPGIMFGVEITEKKYLGCGTTDGTFQGTRYFHCQDNCGLLLSLEKLLPDREGSTLSKAPPGGQEYGASGALNRQPLSEQGVEIGNIHGMNTRSKSKNDSSVDPPQQRPLNFALGDKVVVYNKKGIAIHGTVRWVGGKTAARDFKYPVMGIETKVQVRPDEFEYSHPGMTHLFPAKDKRCQLFVPQSVVFSLEQAVEAKGRHQNSPAAKLSPPTSENKAALAKAMGITEEELLAHVAEEKEARKQAAVEKAKQQAKEVLPDESIDVNRQEEELRVYEREKKKEHAHKREGMGGGLQHGERDDPLPVPVDNHFMPEGLGHPRGQLGDQNFNRQHSWQHPNPHIYDKIPVQRQGSEASNLDPLYGQADQRGNPPDPRGNPPDTRGNPPDPRGNPPDTRGNPPDPRGNPPDPRGNLSDTQHSQGYPLQPQVPLQQSYAHQGSVRQPPSGYPPPRQPQYGQGSPESRRHNLQQQQLSQEQPYTNISEHERPPLKHQPEMKAFTHHPERPDHPPLQHQFSIGSTVQISEPPRYGVIRWIGELREIQGLVAGVELEERLEGCGDGVRHGERYFSCEHGKGMFYPLQNLKPDHRFTEPGHGTVPGSIPMNPLEDVPLNEGRDQTIQGGQIVKYLGEKKGIQGHQNSCYLDATIFGLFALSEEFDSMFLEETTDPTRIDVSLMLWKGIVNPLRRNGVVRFESVMRLRDKLEELGKMKGVNQDEKDPEEFLNMLFKHMLHVEPFISIKRPFGTEQEYFVQLFVEYDESVKLPTVGDLLKRMFKEQNISFTEVPSKLLIQVPRYGKQFKTYKKIVPALELDISELTESPYSCHVCGQSAWNKCASCTEFFKSRDSYIYFCGHCSERAHKPSERSNHKIEKPDEFKLSELELLSVICIETSHYVCFSRSEDRWIFFDSMANRLYDLYNVPKGVDCTREVDEWVYSGDRQRLMDTPPRKLPEYVRRFTQDVYMCVYIQPDAGMYG